MPKPSPPLTDVCTAPCVDWAAALAAHGTWLRKIIFARTGEPQAVEEVFQRVALAAVAQVAPLADATKVAPWLHRLAVVQAARYRRTLGRERRALRQITEQTPQTGNGSAPDPLTWLVAQERGEQTRQALAALAPADAEVLLLKYGERWSYRQLSERLGISEKAVDARLVRARHRLRQTLHTLGMTGEDT